MTVKTKVESRLTKHNITGADGVEYLMIWDEYSNSIHMIEQNGNRMIDFEQTRRVVTE